MPKKGGAARGAGVGGASRFSLYALVCTGVLLIGGFYFLVKQTLEPGIGRLISPMRPAYTDSAPRYLGVACRNCLEKVNGYQWAQLNDVRSETACHRFTGDFESGCLARVADRRPRDSRR